ncbi:hypothetical protein ERO13_A02G001650v2 [Gossypium hirsutum]|nr:hypothetical protein ERO13_A02G001650v2 [Gossypium hirsutum]
MYCNIIFLSLLAIAIAVGCSHICFHLEAPLCHKIIGCSCASGFIYWKLWHLYYYAAELFSFFLLNLIFSYIE